MNKRALYEKIMSSVAKEVKRALNESDEFTDKIHYDMLLSGLKNYGELTHEDIYSIFNDNLYDTDGRELDSLRADGDKIYHAFRTPNGTFEREFYLRDFTDEQLEQIYDFLNDNRNSNIEFFKEYTDKDTPASPTVISYLDPALEWVNKIRKLFVNLGDFYITDGDFSDSETGEPLVPEIQEIVDQYKYYTHIDDLLYTIKDRSFIYDEEATKESILGILKDEANDNGAENIATVLVLEGIYDVVKGWQ